MALFLSRTTKNTQPKLSVLKYGGVGQDRTADTRIFNPLLSRLSYRAMFSFIG
jgi:hypothetical protein